MSIRGKYRCQQGHRVSTRRYVPLYCPICAAPVLDPGVEVGDLSRLRRDHLKAALVLATILYAIVIAVYPLFGYVDQTHGFHYPPPAEVVKKRPPDYDQKVLREVVYDGVVWPTVAYAVVMLLLAALVAARHHSRP